MNAQAPCHAQLSPNPVSSEAPSTSRDDLPDQHPTVDRPSMSPRQRLLARLQSRSAMSWVELLPCAGLLAGVAILVYGQHVRHGGFYWDDWSHASDYRDEGWQFAVNLWHDVLPGRPALAALLPVPYAVFGNDVGAHLAMAVGLGTATSLCFYIFLRALSIEPSGAFAISLLSLLFPWSEAARVWPTASINNLAVCAYLLGTVVALNGLRLEGRRAVLRHGMAALLYLLSLLIYEVAGCAIALSIVLYRTRTSLRRAATRWLFDVLLVVVVLSVSAVYTSRVRHVGSLAERITDVPQFSKQGVSIFASSFLPSALDSTVPKGTVLVACALITGYASFLARDPSRKTLRRWLGVLAVATLGLASAYVMFLGSGLYPNYAGVDTRLHVFAGLAFAALCYAVLVIVVELLPLGRRGALAILTGATLAVAIGFGNRLREDIGRWDRATIAQGEFLSALKQTVKKPAGGSTIFSFGYPAEVSPGIPIFTDFWDLNGALRLTFNDPSLKGLPIYRPGGIICDKSFVYASSSGVEHASPYGRTTFVDVTAHRLLAIRSRSACKASRTQFRPGPRERSSY